MSALGPALAATVLEEVERNPELLARLRALLVDDRPAGDGDPQRRLSVADAAERSRLSESTIRRAVASGELPSALVGRRRLIAAGDLEGWISAGRASRPAARPARPARSRPDGQSFVVNLRSRR